jgi:hypothetical protein
MSFTQRGRHAQCSEGSEGIISSLYANVVKDDKLITLFITVLS